MFMAISGTPSDRDEPEHGVLLRHFRVFRKGGVVFDIEVLAEDRGQGRHQVPVDGSSFLPGDLDGPDLFFVAAFPDGALSGGTEIPDPIDIAIRGLDVALIVE